MDKSKTPSENATRLTLATVSLEKESRRMRDAVSLGTTLALGIIRKHYPHLVDPPVAAPSLSERRDILNRLYRMMPKHDVDLAQRDELIEHAIRRGRM